jgi:hypothetical protein
MTDNADVRILERTTFRAPLGLRFLDAVTRTAVVDGLSVEAWPVGDRGASRSAVRSPLSGLYGFTTLPGLRDYEVGRRPATDWCPNPPPEPIGEGNFVVRAVDGLNRFLPMTLLACLPRESVAEVALFSAPSRPAPAGLATVQGEVWDETNDRPAAWATVEVSTAATSAIALCDQRGMFLALLPYADALPPIAPGPGPATPLSWSVTIRVHYQPAGQFRVDDGPQNPPDVRSLLAQAPATPAAITRELRFGHPLVVATEGRPRLLVQPA